jgi:hypothetical protein
MCFAQFVEVATLMFPSEELLMAAHAEQSSTGYWIAVLVTIGGIGLLMAWIAGFPW